MTLQPTNASSHARIFRLFACFLSVLVIFGWPTRGSAQTPLPTHFKASAGRTCADLFRMTIPVADAKGSIVLHRMDPRLHLSSHVLHEADRAGANMSQPMAKISAWLEHIENLPRRHTDTDPRVIERIKNSYRARLLTKPSDVPDNYFQSQIRAARNLGFGNIELTPDMKTALVEIPLMDQRYSLDRWLEYLMNPKTSYPTWIKYWIFKGISTLGTYDPSTGTFTDRSKGQVGRFADFNREALAMAVEEMIRNAGAGTLETARNPSQLGMPSTTDFSKLYGRALLIASGLSDLSTTEGIWVKFDRLSDARSLVANLEGLGSSWCSAGIHTAEYQLHDGAMHIYFSKDRYGLYTVPRIAIRMEQDLIAEISGVGKDQSLDAVISGTGILSQKLSSFGIQGTLYLKKVEDMRKLTALHHMSTQGLPFTDLDLRFLYQIDDPIQSFSYEPDPRIQEIRKTRNIRRDLARIFGVSSSEISLTRGEFLEGRSKYHFGSLDIDASELTARSVPTLTQRFQAKLMGRTVQVEPRLLWISGSLKVRNVDLVKSEFYLPDYIGGTLYLLNLSSRKHLPVKLPRKIGRGFRNYEDSKLDDDEVYL